MPTTKHRLAITLEDAEHETLKRLAAFQRRPMAGIVAELLREIHPMLQATVAALEQVQKAKGSPAAALATAITRMQGAVEQLAVKATGQLDLLHSEAVGKGDAERIRAQREPSAPRPPGKPRRKAVKGRKRARG
jgi:hypothetical protein